MPRTTSYFGRKIGAVVIEKRKGIVSEVRVGNVYRYTASEQEMGAPLLKFTPQRIFVGKEAKAIDVELGTLRVAGWKSGKPSWETLGDYDTALMTKMIAA